MAGRLALLHREGSIEQEHAPLCPGSQISGFGRRTSKVILEFLKDITQGRRDGNTGSYRKGQPIGLPGPMVGVLPDDYNLDRLGRCQRQGSKNLILRRIDDVPICPLFFSPGPGAVLLSPGQRGRGYRSILPQNSLLTHDFLKFLFRDLEHQGCTRAGAPVDHEYASPGLVDVEIICPKGQDSPPSGPFHDLSQLFFGVEVLRTDEVSLTFLVFHTEREPRQGVLPFYLKK